MNRIRVEFEKGGAFTVGLLEDEAPKTCRIIWERLPFTYLFHQSICSGHAIVTLPPDLTVPRENQRTVGIYPGTLCFLVKDEPLRVPDEIYISYGPYFVSRCAYIDFQQPVNVFAMVESGQEDLMAIGKRILMKGAEHVTFSRI